MSEAIYKCTFSKADGTEFVRQITWAAAHRYAKYRGFIVINTCTVDRIIELVENKRAANFRSVELKSCATCEHVKGYPDEVFGCGKHAVNGHDNTFETLCDDWEKL